MSQVIYDTKQKATTIKGHTKLNSKLISKTYKRLYIKYLYK